MLFCTKSHHFSFFFKVHKIIVIQIVKKIVINVSHLAPIIVEYVRDRADDRIVVSEEDTPLETGGGVVKAVPELGDQPFFVVNGDSLWVDGMKSPLLRLAENWNKDKMDALLMLAPIARAANFDGLGDFIMNQNGNLERRLEKTVSPFAYMGLSIVNPKVLSGAPKGAFSLNWLYDRAIDRGRLSGLVHDGLWYHISTPSDLEIARRRFSDGHASAVAAFF